MTLHKVEHQVCEYGIERYMAVIQRQGQEDLLARLRSTWSPESSNQSYDSKSLSQKPKTKQKVKNRNSDCGFLTSTFKNHFFFLFVRPSLTVLIFTLSDLLLGLCIVKSILVCSIPSASLQGLPL